MELPELPPIDSKDSLPYSAIRYVSGYPESFVQEYAKRYAEQCILMERERCAKACEALGGEEFEDPSGQRRRVEPSADDCAAAIRSPVKEE